MDLFDAEGANEPIVHSIRFNGDDHHLFVDGPVVINASVVGGEEVAINQSLSTLPEQLEVGDEWNVHDHVAMKNHRGGR